LKAEVPTQKKDNKDSRRHTSTAENVEMGPIHNRKKRKNTSGKSSVSTFSGNGLTMESSSSTGSSDQWYKEGNQSSLQSLGRLVSKDDHLRTSQSIPPPSTYLSISLNPLDPPQRDGETNYHFNSSIMSAFSVILSCDAYPLPTQPMGVTIGFIQGVPTTAASLDLFISSVDKAGYGEIDFINYSKDGRPYVTRLSLSPVGEGQDITHYLAMIQTFDNSAGATAITATSASTRSQNNNSGSDTPHFSSSNEDTDTVSSSSNERKKRGKSNNPTSTSSNTSSNVDDNEVINLLSKAKDNSDNSNSSDANSSSDVVEISDNDITSFLANNSDSLSTNSLSSDDALAATKPKHVKPKQNETFPLAAKFVAARVDLETAWRAAYASAMGHNTEILLHHPRQSTSSSGAAQGESSSTESLVQNSTSIYGSNPTSGSSPSPTTKVAVNATDGGHSVKSTSSEWGAEILFQTKNGIDAFLNFSRGAKQSLCLINKKGSIVHVNSSFVGLSGYRLEDCEQKTIKDILWGPGTDTFAYQELWKQVLTTHASNSCILLSYRQMGEGFLSKVGLYAVGKEYFCLFMEEVNAESAGSKRLTQSTVGTNRGRVIRIHLNHSSRMDGHLVGEGQTGSVSSIAA